jgi:hypothetical protein
MSEPATELPPLPGASELRLHIDRQELAVPAWCEKHKLDRFSIQKLLNGKLQRVSVELAFAIQDATSGEVQATLWIPPEEVRDVQRAKRQAIAQERARELRSARLADAANQDAEDENVAG